MDYPSTCFRGIRKSKYVNQDGKLIGETFEPDPRTATDRDDNGQETSINWNDDSGALAFTLDEYPNGAARLGIEVIEYVNKIHTGMNCLKHERDPLPNNPYHGNLVFAGHLRPIEIRQIAGTLALGAVVITKER